MSEPLLPPLLTGFASKDGKGFRYEEMYLELLRLYRREIWDSEPVIRFLLAHDMLEREDIPDCLELLQDREDHDLVAEVLEYSHRRFPEPGAPLLLE